MIEVSDGRPFNDCPDDCENVGHCENTEGCLERLDALQFNVVKRQAVSLTTNRKAEVERAGREVIELLTRYHFTDDELLFILRGLAESLKDVVKDVADVKKDEAKR